MPGVVFFGSQIRLWSGPWPRLYYIFVIIPWLGRTTELVIGRFHESKSSVSGPVIFYFSTSPTPSFFSS